MKRGIATAFLVLIFGGLVLGAGAAVLPACGVVGSWSARWLHFCPPQPRSSGEDILPLEVERAALERRIASLQTELSQRACLPETPAAADPLPTPQGIDEASWDAQDLNALEGCWELEYTYQTRNIVTGEITTFDAWTICFPADAEGVGQQNMASPQGMSCAGSTHGRFDEAGRLVMEERGNLPCSGGFEIHRRIITCDRRNDDALSCLSRQPETGGSGSFQMRRVRG